MTKKRKPQKHKGTTRPEQSNIQPEGFLKHFLRRFWALIVAFSVVSGIYVLWLAFSPSISVVSGQPIDAKNPLKAPFVITNEGSFPLHTVEIMRGIKNEIVSSTIGPIRSDKLHAMFTNSAPIQKLEPKEPTTFFLSGVIEFPGIIESGDIFIRVSFRPSFRFGRQKKEFGFSLLKDESGVAKWYPKAMAKSDALAK